MSWRGALAAAVAVGACLLAAAPVRADSVRDNQWALAAVQAREAWGTTRGEGVTVAVLDTGVDPGHPDLSGQVTMGPDFVGGGAKPGDSYWGFHGTWMASDIAGHGHGSGGNDGVMGIAPAAKILGIRVIWDRNDPVRNLPASQRAALGAGGDPIARGIRYAVDNGAHVINMSLGETATSATRSAETDSAVHYAIARNVVLVASEGNGAETTNLTQFPAAYPGVIAVAATDKAGRRASFSTHEWTTSVAAPGVDVVGARAGGGYVVGDGTSQAAAIVSGVCALIRSKFPKLTPAQVKAVLQRTAAGQPGGTYTEDLGWGIVQAAAALRMAATLPGQPASPSPAAYRSRTFGDGQAPAVGLGALDRRQVAVAAALLPAGGALLVGSVLLAVRRRP